MSNNYKFQGWLGLDKDSVNGKMVWQVYEPKPFDEENDVDIKITHCGICASDLQTLRSGWGPTDYPVCVGHEIVGRAIRVGSKVKNVKVGNRVGVGAQSGHCDNKKGDSEACADANGQMAASPTAGMQTTGEEHHSSWYRFPGTFPSDQAAPMLCGGITGFHPLVQHNAGPNTRVGVIGLGGLGHYAVMGAAQALGCKKVVVISRTHTKEEDARKMGATDFIATDEDKDWAQKHAGTLDVIVSTVSSHKIPMATTCSCLHSRVCTSMWVRQRMLCRLSTRASIQGSQTGSAKDIEDMLQLFSKTGVRTWNNNVPMKSANQAIVDMEAGKARYRYVLCHEDHIKECKID
ncbi:hypothetical protein R6Q59_009909 [Mikania micrantha]